MSDSSRGYLSAWRAPAARIPRRVRFFMMGGLVFASLFGFAQHRKRQPILVEAVPVSRGQLVEHVSSSVAGQVIPAKHIVLRAAATGQLEAVLVHKGDQVAAGTPLALFTAEDANAARLEAAARHKTAMQQVLLAGQRAAQAEQEAAKLHRLATTGAEACQIAESSAAVARERRIEVEVAQARLGEAMAEVGRANVHWRGRRVLAPFAGTVSEVKGAAGHHVAAGDLLVELIDGSQLRVEATLDESEVGALRVGQAATVRCDALGQRPLLGEVSKLDPSVRRDSKGARTLGFEVQLTPEALARGLKPGMSAHVDVEVGVAENALLVPSHLITGRDGNRSVWILRDGRLSEVRIETGRSNWEHTEVLSGLSDSDRIVVPGKSSGLQNGRAAIAHPVAS